MPKFASPPPVAPETWQSLLALAQQFAAAQPWEFAYDSDVVGLVDAASGETRIGCILGNAGQVFAAVFYRRPTGLRWILRMLDEAPDPENLDHADGIDALKLELVAKRELWKEDLAVLKAAGFKPAGRGCVWPQFRSAEPGWHPWHIDQTEAAQLLNDLPRMLAFCELLRAHPNLFEERAPTEIPFLPPRLPDRPLEPSDLDWRPILPPIAPELLPFQPEAGQLAALKKLPRNAAAVFEFDCSLLPGGSFLEKGRPCFGRFSFLVEQRRGLVVGFDVGSGALSPGEAAGRGLIKGLQMAPVRPGKLLIRGQRFLPVLEPLCSALEIRLEPADSLPALEEAAASLSENMLGQMP